MRHLYILLFLISAVGMTVAGSNLPFQSQEPITNFSLNKDDTTRYTHHYLYEQAVYHPLQSYNVIHPDVKNVMDSLLNMGHVEKGTKNYSSYVGEIHFFQGKVSLLSIILNPNKVSNHPSSESIDKVMGVVDYKSTLWYIYSRLPVSNIFQAEGKCIPYGYCEQLIVEKGDTVVRPCFYEDMDDILYGVDLIFDREYVDGDTIAVVIRRLRIEDL